MTSASDRSRSAARALFALTVVVVGVSALATTVWALATVTTRPLDGVEGLIQFEAARMRAHLPLYVDPVIGTNDVPPTRVYVLYPPLWSAALSLVPGSLTPALARVLCFVAFVASLAVTARRTKAGLLALGFTLAFYPVVLFGAAGRPDSVAVLLAALAFARTLRVRGIDVVSGALFALAVFVKPNVMGLAAGAVLISVVTRPRASIPALIAGAATASVVALALLVLGGVTDGTPNFIVHLLRSTGQTPSLALWSEQMARRLPFVLTPLAIVVAFAWPVRKDARVRLALGAVLTTTAWAVLSLSKIGSASNYFMEPAVAAVGLAACAEQARSERGITFTPRILFVVAGLLGLQAVHNGVAAVRSSVEGVTVASARRTSLDALRARCVRREADVVLADEPGLELEVLGRVIHTPFQSGHQFARGRLPREPWLSLITGPHVRCVLAQTDELEASVTPPVEHRQFDPEMKRAIVDGFVRIRDYAPPETERRAQLYVYERRRGPEDRSEGQVGADAHEGAAHRE